MRRIAIALSKGGVGKSTTAVNLAAALAEQGERVLLVDTDTQGQASSMLGCQPSTDLAAVLLGDINASIGALPARERLSLLAGGRGLAGVRRLVDRKDFGAEHTLSEALAPLEGQYEYVLLDTGPGWDALTVNVLFYAQEILSPVSLEVLAVIGLSEFQKSLDAVRRYHDGIELRYVVPTFLDRRVSKSQEILEQLTAFAGDRLTPPIRYNVRLSEAPGFGQTIFEYAPDSPGANDYRALAERIAADA